MRKFTESVYNVKKIKPLVDKIPIDPIVDVEDFRALFKDKISKFRISDVNSTLDGISNENPTMSDDWFVYSVHSTDDYGRNTGDLCYVKAVSRIHARLKGSILMKNSEIFTTGFYDAKKVDLKKSITSVENKIKALEIELKKLKDPF